MKVFALLLSFLLLFMSCETLPGGEDGSMYRDTFSSCGEEEVVEPPEEPEEPIAHDIRIPYDFSFASKVDFSSIEIERHEEPEPIEEPVQEEPQIEVQQTVSETKTELTGDQIVLLACCGVFLAILFTTAYLVSSGRKRYR